MRRHHFLFAATTTMLLSAMCAASAQPVYISEEAISLEQLRGIVIPEAPSGLSRSIVILQQEGAALPSPLQPAVTTTVAPETHVTRRTAVINIPAAPPPAIAERILWLRGVGWLSQTEQAVAILPNKSDRFRLDTDISAFSAVPRAGGRESLMAYGIAPERLVLIRKGMNELLVKDSPDPRNRRVQFMRAN